MELKKIMPKNKRGQLTLQDAPAAVLIVGFVFLVMATIAYIGEKYGDALTENETAYNVTQDLQTEIGDNTSIAGIVLTIILVGIVLGVLIGIFVQARGRRI